MDGEVYKDLQARGFARPGSYEYTGIFSTDGCKKSMGSRINIYPIFYRLNEVRVGLRQKFMFLAGLYVDRAEPKMLSFLKPFVTQLNSLSSRGVKWVPVPGGPEVVSRIFTVGFCVDDLRKGNAVDDLHVLYEFAAPHATELLIKETTRIPQNMGLEVMCKIVDSRLKRFKTPSNISRKPGTCSIANRGQMTGTEWRNWALYYGLPCLEGLIESVLDSVKVRLHELMGGERYKRADKIEDAAYVLGSAEIRAPTEEEMAVLLREGYQNVSLVKTYKRALIRSCKYTVQNLNSVSKTEDCMVFTHSNTYCTICGIVVLQLEDHREVFGMFVRKHDVAPEPPFRIARHVSKLLPSEFDILHFLGSKQIRSPVVRMPMSDCVYVCPLPNHFEID
ncbi:hypothetical protein ONE63_006705 [Megalurothrips usitatus]|uniref:Uncharacterized protein n=1 Tax=Megalurothrips usitatus TaxID=439358 RepID=A0AAV7XWT1_9NEOP|nr:hypothetical protein ONE63_006705 [Megalurothrips usitatus]